MSRQVSSQYDSKQSNGDPASPSRRQQEYVNTGYQHWMQVRQQWRNAPATSPPSPSRSHRPVNAGEILDRLTHSQSHPVHLPYSVPLPTMVEILMEIWEADGLYG
ncbi:hypothetical protein EON65_36040 [archaeon]|nr:MAG: hypothetical protein EON65_36040 [archaeon]